MPYSDLSFNTNIGLEFQENDFINIVHDVNTSIYGRVVSYNPNSGALVMTPEAFIGAAGN